MTDIEHIIYVFLGLKIFKRCLPYFKDKKGKISDRLDSIVTDENKELIELLKIAVNE